MSFEFLALIILFTVTVGLTVLLEARLIPRLRAVASQPIYEGGPRWHMKKCGTPTMGGIAFLAAISVALVLAAIYFYLKGDTDGQISMLLTLFLCISSSFIGIVDDLKKLKRKRNDGLTPMQKLIFQFVIATIYVTARCALVGKTALSFSFGEVELGAIYYPLAVFLTVGIINCANLTDGVDGLCSSVSFAIGIGALYTALYFSFEATVLSVILIGASLGFLFFNLNPARIFMGDTGSLLLGAVLVGICFSLENPLLMILFGGAYVIEGVSVVIQVFVFKATKRRVFKMAPIHHHLERCGLSENTICILSMLLTLLLSIPAFLLSAS